MIESLRPISAVSSRPFSTTRSCRKFSRRCSRTRRLRRSTLRNVGTVPIFVLYHVFKWPNRSCFHCHNASAACRLAITPCVALQRLHPISLQTRCICFDCCIYESPGLHWHMRSCGVHAVRYLQAHARSDDHGQDTEAYRSRSAADEVKRLGYKSNGECTNPTAFECAGVRARPSFLSRTCGQLWRDTHSRQAEQLATGHHAQRFCRGDAQTRRRRQ